MFERDTGNYCRAEGSGDQILNQQWDDPPHMQPPMIPTTASTSQAQYTATITTSREIEMPAERQQANLTNQRSWDRVAVAREKASTFTTSQQVETLRNERQESQLFGVHGNVSTPTRHRQPEQINGKQCPCCNQLTNGTSNQEGQPTAIGKGSSHTEHGGSVANEDKSVCANKEGNRKGPQESKVIRILPDEELDFMDLV